MAVELDISVVKPLARWNRMGSSAAGLAETIDDERFPGAIFPAVGRNGNPIFYALADDAPSWRRLQVMLFAFAGPTITDFEGIPAKLREYEPIERLLVEARLHTVAILRPGKLENSVRVALRALRSLQKAVSRAPDSVVARSEPTAVLLARLQDALNGKDREAAWKEFAILTNELRLDEQNLLQLKFQIHAAFCDWTRIRSDPFFETACAMRPAPASAGVLLEALYWSHFREEKERQAPFIEEDVVQLCRSLLNCIGQNSSPIAEKMLSLLPAEERRRGLIASAWVSESKKPGDKSDALSYARSALLAFAATTNENVRLVAEAKASYERLDEMERRELLSRPGFKAIWSEIQGGLGSGPAPQNWTEWLKRLGDPEFDAIAYARVASAEWRLPDRDLDPQIFQDLALAIDDVHVDGAAERLDQSLPFLVDWVGTDPKWPRTSLCTVYLALLTRVALTTRRGERTIKSTALLLESALRCGLTVSEYHDAMDAVSMIAEMAFNRNTAYDIFEFIDIASSFPAVDENALHDATVAVVTVASGLLNSLSVGQRLAYSRIATQIGWATDSSGFDLADDKPMTNALSNMLIGIYTLTESAGRNARDVLESLESNLRVELNHDHEATAALGSLVARVDLLVVAWASAKHAATNFIKSRRGTKPLIYATGKGSSSLIRAIEEYLAAPDGIVHST